MWTTHVLNATSKKEDKIFQVVFSLSVEKKSLFLAAASRTKDLADLKEHLCLHKPDRKIEDTAASMLPSPHWWCPNKFEALVAWLWHMWWGPSLLSDVSESQRRLLRPKRHRSFYSLKSVFCPSKSSACQIIQTFSLTHPKLFSHTDHWSWSSGGALELLSPEAFLSVVLSQHSLPAFPSGNTARAPLALGSTLTF